MLLKRRSPPAILLGALLSASMPVLALDNPDNTGFYFDNTLNYANVNTKVTTATNTYNGGFVSGKGGGYQFNENFSLEGGYVRYPDTALSSTTGPSNQNELIAIAARGNIPLDSGVNIFGKAGLAHAAPGYCASVSNTLPNTPTNALNNVNDADKKVLPYLGLGLGYAVSRHIDFNIEAAGTPANETIPMLYATTAGFDFRF